MRYFVGGVLLLALVSSQASAQVRVEPRGEEAAPKRGGGGCMPATIACCIGPRVGLEMNEGIPVETSEWLRLILIGVLINDYQAFQQNGCVGCLLENFIGPRVGRQYDSRNVRMLEWLGLVGSAIGLPIPQLIMIFEAYGGKTMTEIEQQEHLSK